MNMAASPRAKTHSALASPSRVALIDRIRSAADPLDAHQLSEQCNLHVTTVRFHLDALINAGLITSKSAPSRGRGRPRLLYSPVMHGDGGAHDGYEDLSWLLLRALSGESHAGPVTRAEAAGYEWAEDHLADAEASPAPGGHELESAAPKINAFFTELGFEPDMTAAPPQGDLEFTLHSCPFHDAAYEYPGIVCNIHLGLLRGALDRFGADGHPAHIEPWATPTVCRAQVTGTPEPAGPADS